MIIIKPKSGDLRIINKFAFFSENIDERRDVWLQFFYKVERFGGESTRWIFMKNFITKEEAEKFLKHQKDNLEKKYNNIDMIDYSKKRFIK